MTKKFRPRPALNSGWFPKGHTGNPKGRPSSSRNSKASVFEVLVEKTLIVNDPGGTREISVEEALQQRTYQDALAGKRMAMREVVKWIIKREAWLEKNTPKPAQGVRHSTAHDPANADALADLVFGWRALRAVKSNAILLASRGATVGVGMGQVNRVDSCRLAVERAGDRAAGSVAASDAFFPFADGLQVLLDAGVRAVVQPGGSIRDGDVIDAAKAAGVTMYLTGARHFAH